MEVRQKKKKRKVKFRISFILLFCAVSLICCFVLYLKENQPESYYDNNGEIIQTVHENAYMPVAESSARSQRYLKGCLFIGGNIVKALADYGYIPKENAFYGDISEDEIYEMAENSLIQGIYLIPDISSEEGFDSDMSVYADFADRLSAEYSKKVYVLSVLPETDLERNEAVDRINQKLLSFAGFRGVYYLDVNSELKDKNGLMPSVYYSEGKLEREVCGRISAYILSHTVR